MTPEQMNELHDLRAAYIITTSALRDIARYGRVNPGYGYSSATKAIQALNAVAKFRR